MRKGLLTIIFVGLTVGIIFAESWTLADIKCPICKTTNKFAFLQSWGSSGPNLQQRLQHIHYHKATTSSWYTCEKCKYSAYMWDFNKPDKKTLRKIRKALPKLELPALNYSDNVTKKLETAELIYKLYKHDDDFWWCEFYRVKGYHYAMEGNIEQARIERLKAFAIAEKLLAMSENDYKRKELLFITSSMKYFANQDREIIKDIEIGRASCRERV